jgi:uncharacterized protein YcfL
VKILILVLIPLLTVGCATTTKQVTPPTVSTALVIESLTATKEVLTEAGEQNTVVAQKIDRALTLAERLDALLEQIEKEAELQANKNIIKPL